MINRGDKCVNCIDRIFDYKYTKNKEIYIKEFRLVPIFILFLASDYQLNYLDKLEDYDQIYMDGTFTAVPKDCLQLITIRASRKNYPSSHLIAIIVLKTKKLEDYIIMLVKRNIFISS